MGAQNGATHDPSSLSPSSPFASTTLSSSVGKSKRPTMMSKSRRLSSSTQSQRPASVPVSSGFSRGRSVSVSAPDEEDDGEVIRGFRRDKDKLLFECEKCSKVRSIPILSILSRILSRFIGFPPNFFSLSLFRDEAVLTGSPPFFPPLSLINRFIVIRLA